MIIRPSTLLRFHALLQKRKYRELFSSGRKGKPGPKGPSKDIIDAIVEMKRRNPRFGCPRIAQQINFAFGTTLDKDVVRRILAAHFTPSSGDGGPSWLTLLGHTKDSLWSVDLFRCESIVLQSHWVLVVMDQFTRRIIGFAVHAGDVDGVTLCRLFNTAISSKASRNVSVPIMIPCSVITSGKPTCGFWISRKSKAFRIHPHRIRLLSD